MKKHLNIILQYILPHHFCARLIGYLTNCEISWWKNWSIRRFIRKYNVNMREALQPDVTQYRHFNEFFIRYLLPGVHQISMQPNTIISPVDGVISEYGLIEKNILLQAKGQPYSLVQLLAGEQGAANYFEQGFYATYYLAPNDYHRIHMPCDGKLLTMWHVPGQLFSVNLQTVDNVPCLFARNERVICLFETEFGKMVVILIGAFFVASIHTTWAGEITSPRQRKVQKTEYPTGIFLRKGEELGYFKLGSTVITLLPPKVFAMSTAVQQYSRVRMGEAVGTIRALNENAANSFADQVHK